MRKKKLTYGILILLLIVAVLFIMYYINNITIYKLENEIKTEFDSVTGIKVVDNGPDCHIFVYVDKECYKFEDIEPIFIGIMIKLDKEENFNYLDERHNRDAKGELAFLHVRFYEEGTSDNVIFEFTSYKDFQIWELEGNASVTYNVSDYTK